MKELPKEPPVTYSIRNYLGGEVGLVEVQPGRDPLSAYADHCGIALTVVRLLGHSAWPVVDGVVQPPVLDPLEVFEHRVMMTMADIARLGGVNLNYHKQRWDSIDSVRAVERIVVDEDDVPSWVAYLVDLVSPGPGWDGVGRIRAAEACLQANGLQRALALCLLLRPELFSLKDVPKGYGNRNPGL